MIVLITGGAGYIGTELVKSLLDKEQIEEIRVYDNLSRGSYNFFLGHRHGAASKVKFIQGDILDSRKLQKALKGVEVVYHLAANVTTPFANTDAHYFEQVNHWGTAELVYAIEKSEVKKLVYTSSIGVYGANKDMISIGTVPNPRTFYGISKMRGEEHVERLKEKIDTFVIRCGNVYGYSKSMRFDAVINKFAFEANFENRISIHGDGKQARAFIHIELIKKALSNIIFYPVLSGTYNLVAKNLQLLDIVDTFKGIYPELEFTFINQHLKLRDIKVDPNCSLCDMLGIDKTRPFEEEVKELIESFSF